MLELNSQALAQRSVKYRIAGCVGEVGEHDGVFFGEDSFAVGQKQECAGARGDKDKQEESDCPRPFLRTRGLSRRFRGGRPGFRFPARRIRLGEAEPTETALADFALFGPTCGSADRMRGPFRLPADMREGDWIELGQLGAYGACLGTAFNGFGKVEQVEVADPPMLMTPGYQEV